MKTPLPLKAFIVCFALFLNLHDLFSQGLTVVVANNTACGVVGNGGASANVNGLTTGYSFEWHSGLDLSGPAIAFTPVVLNLHPGIYSVKATHNASETIVGTENAEVLDVSVDPLVSVEEISPQTSCSSPDGALQAVLENGNAEDFTYEWYRGNIFGTSPIISESVSANGLVAGNYAVLVTHKITNCATIANNFVSNQTPFFDLNIDVHNQTDCISPDGAVTAIPEGELSDYTYAWYMAEIEDAPLLSDEAAIDQLSFGPYSITVKNIATACETTETIFVYDETSRPILNIEKLSDDISCLAPVGRLDAVIQNEQSGEVTYAWYEGEAASGSVVSEVASLQDLRAGTYTIHAENTDGCEVTATETVSEDFADLVTIEIANLSSCLDPNGAVTSSLKAGSLAEYTFQWFKGGEITDEIFSTGSFIGSLEAGTYTLAVVHTETTCESVITVTVENKQSEWFHGIDKKSDLTNCAHNDGRLVALTEGDNSDYHFAWYKGAEVTNTEFSTDQEINKLEPGKYTLVMSHDPSGCDATFTAEVLDEAIIPDPVIEVLSHVTSCDTANGSLSVSVLERDAAQFTLAWKNQQSENSPILSTNELLENVDAGEYWVLVTDKVNGCTMYVSEVIGDHRQEPEVLIDELTPITSCSEPNGAAHARVLEEESDYSFQWFKGTTKTGPVLSENTTLSPVAIGGEYSVLVTHKSTGCFFLLGTDIPDSRSNPKLSLEAGDETITATISEQDDFEWYFNGQSIAKNISEITPSESGDYSLIVTNASGCTSDSTVNFSVRVITGSEHANLSSPSFYPNPTTGFVWIEPGLEIVSHLAITSLTGNAIADQDITLTQGGFLVDLSAQANGVYIAHCTTSSGVRHYRITKK
jgi:hypothetical protein